MTSDMRSGFPSVRFRELIKGKPRHGIYKPPEFFGRGTKIIKMGMQSANSFINEGNILDLVEASAEEIERFGIFENDLLFLRTSLVMEGTGKCSIVKKLTAPALFVSNLIAVSLDKTKANPLFYYYYFSSDAGRQNVLSLCEQTAASTIRSSDLQELVVPFPELEDQNRIANMLYAIDRKIELNSRLNFTLQRIGKALFKRWFVDFEFPNEEGKPYKSSGGEMGYHEEIGKEIPKSWSAGKYSDLVDVFTGKGLKRDELTEDGKYAVLGANGELGRTNEFLFDERLILTGRVGTLGRVYLSSGKVWISDNVLISKPKSEENYYLAYFILKSFDMESLNRGSTQPLVTQTDLKNQPVVLPHKKTLVNFQTMTNSLYNKVDSNNFQIACLSQIRDALLPRLMSGKIRVPIPKEKAEAQ